MTGWKWFWTLVGFLVYIIVLTFLFFYQPFETLFTRVITGISYGNIIFWAAVITGIVGFVTYHWHAYRMHVVKQPRIEMMVLISLRGSAFTGILLAGGATLQAVQIFCAYLLEPGYGLDADFGRRLLWILALLVLTAIFCVIFWFLRIIRPARAA